MKFNANARKKLSRYTNPNVRNMFELPRNDSSVWPMEFIQALPNTLGLYQIEPSKRGISAAKARVAGNGKCILFEI